MSWVELSCVQFEFLFTFKFCVQVIQLDISPDVQKQIICELEILYKVETTSPVMQQALKKELTIFVAV